MNRTVLVAGGVVVAFAAQASAVERVLQWDVDAMTGSASGAFSDSFTGTFNLTSVGDANAEILDMLIDGTPQSTGGAKASLGEFYFNMDITFSLGKIVSGDVEIRADSTGSENIYTATLRPTTSGAILDVGGGGTNFIIGGLTFDGLFSVPTGAFATFLGVDINTWGSVQPLPGDFANIAFQPTGPGNIDEDVDSDVFVSIPLPSGAALAGLGLAGVLVRRRR